MSKGLVYNDGDHVIQAMSLVKGKIGLTTGTFTDIKMIYCIADGSFTITWNDDTTTSVVMTEDRVHTLTSDVKNIILNSSGTYNLS